MRLHRVWSACAVLLLAALVTSCAEGQFGQVVQAVGKNMAKGMCAEGKGPSNAAPEFCLYVTELRLLNHDTEADVSLTIVNRTGRRLYLTVPSWPYLTDSSGTKWAMTKNTGIVYSGYGAPLSLEPGIESQASFLFQRQGQAPSDLTFSMRGEISIARTDSRGEPVPGQPQVTRGFNFSGIRLAQQEQPATQPLQQKSLNPTAPSAVQDATASATSATVQADTHAVVVPAATAPTVGAMPPTPTPPSNVSATPTNADLNGGKASQRVEVKEGKRLDASSAKYIYHKLSGERLDLKAIAASSEKVLRANEFDRADLLSREIAILEADYSAADPQSAYQFLVAPGITYDHDRQAFVISTFNPGTFIDLEGGYRVVFVNSDRLQYFPMEKEKARAFDQGLSRGYLVAEINARIIGVGDPTGMVDTQNTLRAVIVDARVVDQKKGTIVYAPKEIPRFDPASDPKSISFATVDILGLKTGMSLDAFRNAIEREHGKTGKVNRYENDDPRFVGGIGYEPAPCYAFLDKEPKPGAVCIRGYYDETKTIRKIVVEQVLEKADWGDVRKSLLKKYGGVVVTESQPTGVSFGWGAKVASLATAGDRTTPNRAITAVVSSIQTFLGRSTNSISTLTNLRIRLIDPAWAGPPEKPVEPKSPQGPKL